LEKEDEASRRKLMGERKVMMGRDFWGAGSSTQAGEGELGKERER
jgi:hypothetical protein